MKKKTNENTSERKAVMRHATDTEEPSNENFVGRLNLQRIDENESIVTKRMEQCETNRFDFKPINNITKKKELQKSNTPNFRIVLKRLTVEDLMEAGIIMKKKINENTSDCKALISHAFDTNETSNDMNSIEIRKQPIRVCAKRQKLDQVLATEKLIAKKETNTKIRKLYKAPKPKKNALMPSYHKYELVWGYVKGYPSWPAVIEDVLPNGKYRLHFFGDYTKFDMARKNLTHFFEGFNLFSCNFGNLKLRKAVEEAKIFLLGGHNDMKDCFICSFLEFKTDYFNRLNID